MDMTTMEMVITVLTVLGSAGAWQYYTRRSELKAEAESSYRKLLEQEFKLERDEFRDTTRNELQLLRHKLHDIATEKIVLADRLARLEAADQELRTRVELLERKSA